MTTLHALKCTVRSRPRRMTPPRCSRCCAGATRGQSTDVTAVPLAAVVLAGGASRRMGRDKAMLPYQGGTLIEHVVAAVGARCAPVFVIAAPGQRLPALNAEILRDEVQHVGPLIAT